MLEFVKPNFVRAIESAVPWFEVHGYRRIGDWKMGRRYRTAVMVREKLIHLAGRLRTVLEKDNAKAEKPET